MKTSAITLAIAILGVLHGPLLAAVVTKARKRSKPPAAVPDYPGIRLRISTANGVILETDTDELHQRAALYRRDWDGWFDLIAGGDAGTTEFSTVPLKIEVKPVRLNDA